MVEIIDSSYSIGIELLRITGELAVPIFILLIIGGGYYVKNHGFGGRGFWGKKSKKITEFNFKENSTNKKMIIYNLSGEAGYQGYGIEFITSGSRRTSKGQSFKVSMSGIEFTKNEANEIVKILKPHLSENNA